MRSLSLLLILLCGPCLAHAGLVGWWRLDTGSGTAGFDSVNGNHCSLTNMEDPGDWVAGRFGRALTFDGVNESCIVADPLSGVLDPTSAYSIAVWVNYTGTPSVPGLVSKTTNGSGGGYELFATGANARFSSCDTAGSCAGGWFDIISSGASINDGTWHHLAATVATNSTAKIYIDGIVRATSGTVTQNNLANAITLKFASRGTTGWFTGALDEIKIWNHQLSAAEVMRDFIRGRMARW